MIGSEEKAAVMRVMDRGILSGYQGNWSDAFYGGEEVHALEKEWAEYFGVKHAIAVNSATSGLWAACAAILQPMATKCDDFGDRFYFEDVDNGNIIVSPYSMTCSASIPLHFGAKPVFADIERDYYCLDPASVEAAITPRTKAIIVVDLFGQTYDAEAINEIAERKGKEYGHKIYVIEDAAQAAGAKYKGKYAGTLGHIGVFSLNRHKHINCGEGGVVVTDNDELAFKIRLLCNHAEAVVNDIDRKETSESLPMINKIMNYNLVGMNMRMTELSAAVAREQLKKLGGILKVIREHAELYFGCNGSIKTRPDCEHAFYRYAGVGPLKLNMTYTQEDLEKIMHVKRHYITPLYRMPLFKALGYQDGLCPVCEEVKENIVLAWLKEGI